jgi:hypothetical protein
MGQTLRLLVSTDVPLLPAKSKTIRDCVHHEATFEWDAVIPTPFPYSMVS